MKIKKECLRYPLYLQLGKGISRNHIKSNFHEKKERLKISI